MKASLQKQIAPPEPVKSQLLSATTSPGLSSNKPKVDFKSLLVASNKNYKQKNEKIKKGDLSDFKTYEGFLDNLHQQTLSKDVPKNNLDKDDFLKLFVVQLQSQNPLNPKDGTEMAAQLAQFNSLEQMMNVNKTLEKIGSEKQLDRGISLAHFIGKEVSVVSDQIRLDNNSIGKVSYSLKKPAQNVVVNIHNKVGEITYSQELGAVNSGEHKLVWDGKNAKGELMASGKYQVTITAQNEGNETEVQIANNTTIEGINLKAKDGKYLITPLGEFDFSNIKNVTNINNEIKNVTNINNESSIKVENKKPPIANKGSS